MIQDRIIQYLAFKGLSKYKFYKETGLSNGFLDKKGTIGADKCAIIYSVYPDINLEWLITGNGNILKENFRSSSNNDKTIFKSDLNTNNIDSLKMIIKSQEETILAQKMLIDAIRLKIVDSSDLENT